MLFRSSHDGFTLQDLVSYREKHNEANGEGNRDGDNNNFSDNYGVEGPTKRADVNAVRGRQVRRRDVTLALVDHLHVSAQRNQADAVLGIAALHLEQLRTKAERERQDAHAVPARQEEVPELVDEDEDTKNEKKCR